MTTYRELHFRIRELEAEVERLSSQLSTEAMFHEADRKALRYARFDIQLLRSASTAWKRAAKLYWRAFKSRPYLP